jgi:Tol biopolymer transport system component
VALVLGIGYWVLIPEVVGFNPLLESGHQSNNAVIEITFSRPMQPDSVLQNLSIFPAMEGEYSWPDETVLRFVPSGIWPSGTQVEVRLEDGSRSRLGLAVRQPVEWTFQVSPVKLLYLWPATGGSDIYALVPDDGESEQITFSGDVVGYDASPDGHWIYYFRENNLGGNDLYFLNRFAAADTESEEASEPERLLTCQRTLCTSPQISPDGNWLAYLRNDSEIWLLDLQSGSDPVQVSPNRHDCRSILWAPDGRLSYYNATAGAYIIRNMDTGKQTVIDNLSGEAGAWAPGGTAFVVPEVFTIETDILRGPSGEADLEEVEEEELEPVRVLSTHLLVYQTNGSRMEDLSADLLVEDFSPAFSPDGRLLAFTRRYLVEEPITLGRQIWVLSFSGSGTGVQSLPLTDQPDYKYTAITWHPEGRQFVSVRSNQVLLTEPPELWLLDLDGNMTRLLIGGYEPQWIP